MSCVVVSDKGAASGWTVLVLVLVLVLVAPLHQLDTMRWIRAVGW